MKKAVISLVLPFILLFSSTLTAQKVLHSEKDMITIRFNEFDIAWHLQPELNPDIFTVGATFQPKRVSVVTASDSLSFLIKPGQKENVIVYLNNVPCHILVEALHDPLFLHPLPGILAILVTLCVVFIAGRANEKAAAARLLKLGALSPILFWVFTIIAGWLHGDYNHLHGTVSELTRIDTRSEYFMAVSICFVGLLALVFSIGFFKVSRRLHITPIPAILSFSMAVSLLWASVFSAGHELHGILGPLPLLMMIGNLVSIVAWPKSPEYRSLRLHSAISLFIMCLFFFRFVPGILQGYEGALQRCMYAGWTYWYLSLNIHLRKNLSNNTPVAGVTH